MRLLVTGGAGFIGSNFIRYILETYPTYYVVNYDLLTYAGNLESLREFEPRQNYKFVKGDIADEVRVKEVVKENDITHIVNFAAESHVDRSIEGPSIFVRSNVLGTQVLLEVARKVGIERFHHISTDEVFGSLELNSRKKFNENTPYDPKSPYSASKAASDHVVRAYWETYEMPVTITNCSNNYGPFQSPEKFLPRMITNLIDDKKLPIYGDGKYVRDWLHVEDHCRAIDLVIHKGKEGETYLVGGMQSDTSNLDIAYKLIEIFDKDEDYIEFVKDRPGHDRRYAVDWSKLNKELDWEPLNDFDSWLSDSVEWYKENEWWWRPQKQETETLYKEKLGYGALKENA